MYVLNVSYVMTVVDYRFPLPTNNSDILFYIKKEEFEQILGFAMIVYEKNESDTTPIFVTML